MAFDETTLQRQWKITVAICLAYGAVLSVVFGLILYDSTVAGRLVGLMSSVGRVGNHRHHACKRGRPGQPHICDNN